MTAAALLAEAAQFGITLWAENGAVRYRPKTAMPTELAAKLRANRDDVLLALEQASCQANLPIIASVPQVETNGTESVAGRAHDPVRWGGGQCRRLVGNDFSPRPLSTVPDAILADAIVLCPQCRSCPVLAELREMTGGLCYPCWEAGARS